MQKDRRKKRREGQDMETIGFALYEVSSNPQDIFKLFNTKLKYKYVCVEIYIDALTSFLSFLQVPNEVGDLQIY